MKPAFQGIEKKPPFYKGWNETFFTSQKSFFLIEISDMGNSELKEWQFFIEVIL